MKTPEATALFAALGHESRLAIFRLLVEAGPAGIPAGALAAQLDIPAPTLSFHLAGLSRVGLIRQDRDGRFIRYSTVFEKMDELIEFLTRNCCHGRSCLSSARSGRDED